MGHELMDDGEEREDNGTQIETAPQERDQVYISFSTKPPRLLVYVYTI